MKPFTRAALVMLAASANACAPRQLPEDPARMAALKATYEELHRRLETAAAADPIFASALGAKGQIVVAIRSGLIEELAGNVTQRYLDHVKVDLREVTGHGSGEIDKDTFLGRMKVGEWDVRFSLGDLAGDLTAGTPRVGLRGPNLIDIEMPVDVHQTEGGARLDFTWDSHGVANALCHDFEITREIRGRVLNQKHVLSGALRLENTGDSLTATPVFPNRTFLIKLDLTPKSWAVVEEALQTQNSFGKCGMLMKPARAVTALKELGAEGVKVKLPDSIFRVVSLPGHLEESVEVNDQEVSIALKSESLRIDTSTLWSSASVQVGTAHPKANKPAPSPTPISTPKP